MAVDKKNVSMTIFLLKSRCGFREQTKDSEEDADTKAQIARETLDRMNAGLAQFQAPDGAFVDPKKKRIRPAPVKKKRGKK